MSERFFTAQDQDKKDPLSRRRAAELQMSGHTIVNAAGDGVTLFAQDVLSGEEDAVVQPAAPESRPDESLAEVSLSDLREGIADRNDAELEELLEDDRKGARDLAQKELDRRHPVRDDGGEPAEDAVEEVQEEQQEGQNTPAGTEAVDDLRRERGFLPDEDKD